MVPRLGWNCPTAAEATWLVPRRGGVLALFTFRQPPVGQAAVHPTIVGTAVSRQRMAGLPGAGACVRASACRKRSRRGDRCGGVRRCRWTHLCRNAVEGVDSTSAAEFKPSRTVGRVAGLEPATSALFWQRSDQLSYTRRRLSNATIGCPRVASTLHANAVQHLSLPRPGRCRLR